MNFFPWIVSGTAGLGAWFSIRYAWWSSTISWKHPRILMYHMIQSPRKGERFNGMRVASDAFEWQLNWLCENGFRFQTISQLIENPLREKSVALTFDDGFEDNFTNAFPLLKRYGAKATLYVVVQRHDGRDWSIQKKAHHKGGELLRESKMSDEQIKTMLKSGLFELGAHTLSHANLRTLNKMEKQKEIQGSREALEQRFAVPVQSFAYPFGIWSEADREIVGKAGFTTAVTTDRGISHLPFKDPLTLRRIKISGKEGKYAFELRIRSGRRSIWK